MYYFLSLALFLGTSSAFSQCLPQDQISNQYIVRLRPEGKALVKSLSLPFAKMTKFKHDLRLRSLRYRKIFEPLQTESSAKSPPATYMVTAENIYDVAFLQSHPEVDTLEPDCAAHLMADKVPNDPMFPRQWGLNKINAPAAWSVSSGSSQIIVAVSDSGIDYLHEDLKDNMWINPGEIPGNGIDDDGNGCVDDIYGCDLSKDDGDPMPPPGSDTLAHGTHVAGIIGAVGNNGKGISGVAQHVRLMAVKGFSNLGGGSANMSDLIQTVYYAVNNGAQIINCSWGRQGMPMKSEIDAFSYAHNHGVVVVVAAGNDNLDASGYSPAGIATVITVAATDEADALARYSNWGSKIDVAAPGGKGFDFGGNMLDPIFSTLPTTSGGYGNLIGTSMAAPFVSGLAALILSVNPGLDPEDVRNILKAGGDMISVSPDGGTKTFNYPRINALKSLLLAENAPRKSGAGSPSQVISGPPQSSSGGGCGLIKKGSLKTAEVSFLAGLLFVLMPLALALVLRRERNRSSLSAVGVGNRIAAR